uniref:Uncharacterized protein n=1 Tax=Labrus bergylta TaxID=56723 RepID=A0A3Q3F4K7_9LABR
MAEDHGLCDGEAAVQITESRELVLLLPTEHIELLDGVQRLLLAFQPDDIWLRNHLLCKPPHRVLEGGREKEHLTVLCFSERNKPVDANALVPVTLCRNHHICLVQHKHCDLLWVNELVFGAPVEDRAWCSNDNLLLQLDASIKLPHLLNDLTDLQSELVCCEKFIFGVSVR